ncbi:uncharacterized protein LOC121387074 [Gigantopelta aegis]|uniref:uncharacterized protein LOC121387074 n=1 Tax=Gigantopelta aegis TaxID=1735272 RepID=UPI001B88D084|nr:uncharacterized protein LOC121387074 [Gigantopelta aegis]
MKYHHIAIFAVFLSCIYVTALPVSAETDFRHLMEVLGKLRNIVRKRQNSEPSSWSRYKSIAANGRLPLPKLADIQSNVLKESQEDDATDMRKRQGAWSYDYGLGGGRFGKRNYGDYGIGGGRFGRDVDHVDLTD